MDKLQRLFASLMLSHHNLKVLHWNVVGPKFDSTHEYLDDLAHQLYDYIDTVAEIMVSKDVSVLTLNECITVLGNDVDNHYIVIDSNERMTGDTADMYVSKIMELLYALYDDAHDGQESDICSTFDEHMAWIRKEAFYKNRSRLVR